MRKKIYPIDYSVSVVIPAYQAEHTINRAIKSILKQTLLPAEIVVIDDGSDDRTLEIVEGLRVGSGRYRNVQETRQRRRAVSTRSD